MVVRSVLKRAKITNGEIGPVADQNYEIRNCTIFTIRIIGRKSNLCIRCWLKTWLKIGIFAHLSSSIISPPPIDDIRRIVLKRFNCLR